MNIPAPRGSPAPSSDPQAGRLFVCWRFTAIAVRARVSKRMLGRVGAVDGVTMRMTLTQRRQGWVDSSDADAPDVTTGGPVRQMA